MIANFDIVQTRRDSGVHYESHVAASVQSSIPSPSSSVSFSSKDKYLLVNTLFCSPAHFLLSR